METIIYLTNRKISDQQLVQIVEQLGGFWDFDPTLNHGVISATSGTVYVNMPVGIEAVYGQVHIKSLGSEIQMRPEFAICIDYGHQVDSSNLAIKVAKEFVQQWGGTVDGNNVLDIED